MCNACWQVVTPASTAPARARDSSTAAGTSLASSVAQAAVQQPQVIGVRTLLEFVAWLVCSSGQAGSPGVQKGKQATQLGMNSRQGAVFLTEELSDVGVAVRRLQVSRAAHAYSSVSKPSNLMNTPAKWVCAVNTIVHWVIRVWQICRCACHGFAMCMCVTYTQLQSQPHSLHFCQPSGMTKQLELCPSDQRSDALQPLSYTLH